jgi:hypothetical protein
LLCLSLADPAAPQTLDEISVPALVTGIAGEAHDLTLRGSYAYLAVDLGGVLVIDVSTPADLQVVGRIETAGSAVGVAATASALVALDAHAGLATSWLQCEPVTAASAVDLPVAGARLLAPHPNPFNPRVVIPFATDRDVPLRLAVYDLAGRRIVTLREGPVAPGSHEVVWDGRDDRGRAVPSGVYLVRLVADGAVTSRRVVLLR